MKLDPLPHIPDGPGLRNRCIDLFQKVNSTVNRLIEGNASILYAAQTSYPTSGTFAVGDYVHNSAPVEAGSASSKYIVFGWKRLTSGSGNVLNTDWFEDRHLTGN